MRLFDRFNRANRSLAVLIGFVLVPVLCGLLTGQQPAPQAPVQEVQPPAQEVQPKEDSIDFLITTQVDVVTTPALVFDRDGNYVNGLQPQDFRLYDNGKLQDLQVDVTFIPISLVICIQSNSAVQGLLPHVTKIGGLVQPLLIGEMGTAAVIAYDGRIRTLQEFTNDSDKITKAVKTIAPGSGSNRLVDAVFQATRMLRNQPKNRRRIIMVIGETRDNSSEVRPREALIALQMNNVQVYGVDMSRFMTTLTAPPKVGRPETNPPAHRGPLPMGQASTPTTVAQAYGLNAGKMEFVPVMVEVFRDVKAVFKANPVEVFTRGTGGSEFGFRSQRTLEEAIQRVGDELHAGYFLSYTPNNKGDGGFHEIKVEIPTRPDVKRVQTRPGYWLAPKPN